jgi:hypothetical protein
MSDSVTVKLVLDDAEFTAALYRCRRALNSMKKAHAFSMWDVLKLRLLGVHKRPKGGIVYTLGENSKYEQIE